MSELTVIIDGLNNKTHPDISVRAPMSVLSGLPIFGLVCDCFPTIRTFARTIARTSSHCVPDIRTVSPFRYPDREGCIYYIYTPLSGGGGDVRALFSYHGGANP